MDPFEVLGVQEDADDAAVQAAYSAALRRFPPDREPARFQEVRRAYELIRDVPARRRLKLFGFPRPHRFADLAPKTGAALPVMGLEVWQSLLSERKG